MTNVIAFPIIPKLAPVAVLSLDADEVRTLQRALQAYGAIVVECTKGADNERTRLDYAACADDAARLGERLWRLAI